jgi:anti-sigma factor RsiW
MTHPAGARIQAYLDGELSPADADALGRHIEACPRCTALIARLRERAAALSLAVRTIDAAGPAAWRTRAADQPVRRGAHPRGFRRAAIILLAVSGAAAAATLGREAVVRRAATAEAGDAAAFTDAAPPAAGVFMTLRTDSAEIVIEGAGLDARVRVRAGDRADVSVSVEGGAGAPRFRVDERAGRVHVALGGGDALVSVDVPARLRAGVVRSGGRVVVRIREGRIEPLEAAGAGIPLEMR